MKKLLSVGLLTIMFVPLFANASWWNPIDWFSFIANVFHPQVVEKVIYVPATSTPMVVDQQTSISSVTPTPVTKKESKKVTPAVDNSALIQAQVNTQLKAKAEQDALVAKQKADEQAKIDVQNAANAVAQQTQAAKLQADIAAQEAEAKRQAQQQEQAKIAAIQAQITALRQQILDIKTTYYKQAAGAQSSGTAAVAQGEVARLTNEANQKISLLNLQIQQLDPNAAPSALLPSVQGTTNCNFQYNGSIGSMTCY